MKKYRVYNIDWDTDIWTEEEVGPQPKEMIVMAEDEDEAVDKATDENGYCIFNCMVEEVV